MLEMQRRSKSSSFPSGITGRYGLNGLIWSGTALGAGGDHKPIPYSNRVKSTSAVNGTRHPQDMSSTIGGHTPIHIPTFGPHDGFSKGTSISNSSEMLIGALRAGDSHYQYGMRLSDILEVVRSVYSLQNAAGVNNTLERTLDKLVATGVVSRSYGSQTEDATFRLVGTNPRVTQENSSLVVTGTGIKPSPHHFRFRSGQCLPGGGSHVTRVARTSTSEITASFRMRNSGNSSWANSINPSLSDSILSKSLAERSGVRKELKPTRNIPNSPTTSERDFPNMAGYDYEESHLGDEDERDVSIRRIQCPQFSRNYCADNSKNQLKELDQEWASLELSEHNTRSSMNDSRGSVAMGKLTLLDETDGDDVEDGELNGSTSSWLDEND